MGNLCWPCHKIGQGHLKVIIYINFVELVSLVLHTKIQNHSPSGSGEEDFLRFLLLIAMTAILTIHINLYSPFLRMLHTKFGFDWPCGIREDL